MRSPCSAASRSLDRDPGQLGAAERPGEAQQQQRPVAQPGQVVADRRQDLAQDADLGREFRPGTLACLLGQPVEPGKGLGDRRRGGGGGAAGEVVQVADRGDPEPQRVGRERLFPVGPVAFGGEEGGDVGRPGGQGVRPCRPHQAHQARTPAR